MRITSTSTALFFSAAAGLASVSALAPSPIEPLRAENSAALSPSRCMGYVKLHLMLASTSRTHDFIRSGECRVRIDVVPAAAANFVPG